MKNADLALQDPNISLSVRAFTVKDGLSQLFDVLVTAGSAAADLELESIAGHPAAFRLATGLEQQPYAVWSGLCSQVDQVGLEEDGQSIYALRLVPMLWRCGWRRNHRVFQHQSTPEVVRALLSEWDIDVELRLDESSFPRHEYRVQFGESDLAFISRLLEEAGISYLFEQVDPRGAEKKDGRALPNMRLVLSDNPCQTAKRLVAPVAYRGNTEQVVGDSAWVTKVRFGRAVRSGRYTLAGYDYRSSPELKLLADARAGLELEERYEQFHYLPGAFLAEPRGGSGEDRGAEAAVNEELGQRAAAIGLDRLRSGQRSVGFTSNQLTLAPGIGFAISGHPRPELTDKTALLVVSRLIEGELEEEWRCREEAVFASESHRPQLQTPKPRVMGVQSAVVVGPQGEEIYTDELGRVRVQFHWDRYGQHDEASSCWIRVSQGWAGSGYGMSHIPRVGHEVLVDFFEGDPDRPIVVGRAYHRGAVPPDQLPRQKTKSTWRSASSPGGEGYNELSMDDAAGEELLFLRAQKNLKQIVLADEESSVGANLTTTVRQNETRTIGGDQELVVSGDQAVEVKGRMSTNSLRGYQAQAGRTTGVSCSDGKLTLTNGKASIVLDGPHIYIDSGASVRISSTRLLSLSGKQVNIDGRPDVYINSGNYAPAEPVSLPVAPRAGEGHIEHEENKPRRDQKRGRGRAERPGGMEEAEFNGKEYLLALLNDQLGTKWKWPKNMRLPPEIDEQLERLGRVTFKGGRVKTQLMDPETYQAMRERFDARIEAEKDRLGKLRTDLQEIFDSQRGHYQDLGQRLKERGALEKTHLGKFRDDLADVLSGKKGNFIESCKALGQAFKEEAGHLNKLRKDIVSMIDSEMAAFKKFKRQWKAYYNDVKGYADDIKALINDPKDAILDIVFGEDKQLAKDIADLAEDLGFGDDVADFLGVGDDDVADGVADAVQEALPDGPSPHPHPIDKPHFSDKWKPVKKPGDLKLDPDAGKKLKGATAPKEAMRGPAKADLGKAAAPRGPAKANLGGAPGSDMTQGAAHSGAKANLGGAQSGGMAQGAAQSGAKANIGGAQSGSMVDAAHGGAQANLGQAQSFDPQQISGGAEISQHAGAGAMPGGQSGSAGEALSRAGGLGASDVAGSVQPDAPTFLQSPGEGQLMVLPTGEATAVDPALLQGAMVEAQMGGQPAAGAISDTLAQKGYAVYTRSWGDWFGTFVQSTAKAAP